MKDFSAGNEKLNFSLKNSLIAIGKINRVKKKRKHWKLRFGRVQLNE